ncbi:PD-(D/E)XK nuclease superfamily protein [Candidatus Desulfarcum epimagneticum]|uniref:PD-(D/E)XK nuclease superfamily protein n=1 Tax=uncultured Desulfobacteraceae bacterium TaxID=218296 RepID=A0A484HEI2_9BACT|nr:PD-(D/E)XK nuclease superfamily protein [uncultured Desulfobacteraceae bacterium]
MKKLSIGISDFRELREEDRYFVDKSLFIQDIIDEDARVVLLPRPRRFGKTLNLSMLRYFFEKTGEKDRIRTLFHGLSVEKEPVFEKHLCAYPVIHLSFKDVKSLQFEDALKTIKLLISKEFGRLGYLRQSEALTDIQKSRFDDILAMKAETHVFEASLGDLSQYLYHFHNKKPLILIDEYDTPIHVGHSEGYYKEIIAFFRSFLGAGLKDNPYIFKGVLTGILRVAKESIFSGINNLAVYTILREEYRERFGFSENEVSALMEACGAKDRMEDVRRWYDGYLFGGKTVYNPWSILNFASSKDKVCRPYWANTSSNDLIKSLVKGAPHAVREGIQDILNDVPVESRIEENIVFEDLPKDEVAVYNFFLFCGYLKAFDPKRVDHEDHRSLLAPNLEVRQIFKHAVMKWINESYESHKLKEMLKAVTTGDAGVFETLLGDFVAETLSYFDTAGKNVEKVYQAFILGLLVNLAADYEIASEKESGFGRYDISVIPKDPDKTALILELKTIRPGETKDEALESAVSQIEERKYETALIQRGIQDIRKWGVVFDGKRVWVRG